MARGNQRDKAREAAQKKLAGQVSRPPSGPLQPDCPPRGRTCSDVLRRLQKKGSGLSGTEMQRNKEQAAEIMRQKQAAGMSPPRPPTSQLASVQKSLTYSS